MNRAEPPSSAATGSSCPERPAKEAAMTFTRISAAFAARADAGHQPESLAGGNGRAGMTGFPFCGDN
jgi:hypothetical protein